MVIALGAFDLQRPVARGGMARVWEAVHRRSGQPAAIKVITADRAREMAFRVRFAHEVRAVARLDHPAVVRVYDHGTVSAAASAASEGALPVGMPYLAMEWIEGGAISTGGRRRGGRRCAMRSSGCSMGWRMRTRGGWCIAISRMTTFCWPRAGRC